MTTRAELRARGDLSPDEADDVFELAARLQVADRAFDPARRPLGEGRALPEDLDVAAHFIEDARVRLARREVAAATVPLRAEAPSRWPLLVAILVVSGLIASFGTLLVGRDRVTSAARDAARAERALTAELLQQIDRASAVEAMVGAGAADVARLRTAATDAPDVPERLVAVGALGREMQRVLQDLPTPTTEERARIHSDLAQQVRDSRLRIDGAARGWRDANGDWMEASERGPGRLAVLTGLAEAPPGPRRTIPRP